MVTGDGEPSGTTVAEDLESLDKDALILKLKQVGVALYEQDKVIWSSINHTRSSGQDWLHVSSRIAMLTLV